MQQSAEQHSQVVPLHMQTCQIHILNHLTCQAKRYLFIQMNYGTFLENGPAVATKAKYKTELQANP